MQAAMRGICKMSAGPGYEYRTDLPIPEIKDDEVLMKVHATAVCGTDMHILAWNEWAANRMKNLPIVFGHETAGEIVRVGAAVTDLKVGDRISVETHIPCGHCFSCRTGNPHICENMKLFGVTEPGAFAEYAPVPAGCAVPLAEGVSYEMGAMLEAMGAGVHGVERADVKGKTVLVSGCGPIGLMAIGATFEMKKVLGRSGPVTAAAGLKLVGFCAVLLPVAVLMGFRGQEMAAICIMLGSSTAVSSYVMAVAMGHEGVISSGAVMLTTLLSGFSLTGWVWLMRALGFI